MQNKPIKLAIICTHPIQYYSPWFQSIHIHPHIDLKVFFLWEGHSKPSFDPSFKQTIQWDVPLLEGFPSEFVPNISKHPGSSSFRGLQNPSLTERIQPFSPDAILTIGYKYQSLLKFIFSWKQCPIFLKGDSHRLSSPRSPLSFCKRKILTQIFKKFSAFLYAGTANKNYFLSHGAQPNQLFFSPHAVNPDLFSSTSETRKQAQQLRKQLNIPTENRVILFVGKLIPEKSPLLLLEAFKKWAPANVSLVFTGSGILEQTLRTQANSKTFFLPFQNQSEMPAVYQMADILVLPSQKETWGLVLNEAMQMGKPVIASSHVGAAQDLIHPDQNGLIFPSGNSEALAECLGKAFSNLNQLSMWGNKSLNIIQNFSYEQATHGLFQALQHTLPHENNL